MVSIMELFSPSFGWRTENQTRHGTHKRQHLTCWRRLSHTRSFFFYSLVAVLLALDLFRLPDSFSSLFFPPSYSIRVYIPFLFFFTFYTPTNSCQLQSRHRDQRSMFTARLIIVRFSLFLGATPATTQQDIISSLFNVSTRHFYKPLLYIYSSIITVRDSTGNIDEGIIYTITSYYVAHYKLFNLEIASFIYFNEQVGPDFLTDGVLSSPLLF